MSGELCRSRSERDGAPLTQVAIPSDQEAEECVVGIAVGSAAGARLATERLAPEDFYRPAYARVLEVAAQLTSVAGEDRRVCTIARLAGVRESELAWLVAERPCSVDSNGAFARRVKEASRRRRIMALASELYNGAASDSVESLRDSGRELLAELAALPERPSDGSEPQ